MRITAAVKHISNFYNSNSYNKDVPAVHYNYESKSYGSDVMLVTLWSSHQMSELTEK